MVTLALLFLATTIPRLCDIKGREQKGQVPKIVEYLDRLIRVFTVRHSAGIIFNA